MPKSLKFLEPKNHHFCCFGGFHQKKTTIHNKRSPTAIYLTFDLIFSYHSTIPIENFICTITYTYWITFTIAKKIEKVDQYCKKCTSESSIVLRWCLKCTPKKVKNMTFKRAPELQSFKPQTPMVSLCPLTEVRKKKIITLHSAIYTRRGPSGG